MPLSESSNAETSHDDWSSSPNSSVQAREAAKAARLAEFTALVNLNQEAAPESMDMLARFINSIRSSSESEWVAISGVLAKAFTPEDRLELIEEKLPVVTQAASAAVVSVQRLRSGLLLEIRTLFHANQGSTFDQFDFSVEADTFESALISLASAVQALNAKFVAFNKIRFEQSSPSDGVSDPSSSSGPSSSFPTSSSFPAPLRASTSIQPSVVTTTTGVSAPVAGPLGRGRGLPLKPQSQSSSSGGTRDGVGRGAGHQSSSSSDDRHTDGSLF